MSAIVGGGIEVVTFAAGFAVKVYFVGKIVDEAVFDFSEFSVKTVFGIRSYGNFEKS